MSEALQHVKNWLVLWQGYPVKYSTNVKQWWEEEADQWWVMYNLPGPAFFTWRKVYNRIVAQLKGLKLIVEKDMGIEFLRLVTEDIRVRTLASHILGNRHYYCLPYADPGIDIGLPFRATCLDLPNEQIKQLFDEVCQKHKEGIYHV